MYPPNYASLGLGSVPPYVGKIDGGGYTLQEVTVPLIYCEEMHFLVLMLKLMGAITNWDVIHLTTAK